MACGACGSRGATQGTKIRVTFNDGTTADYLSRAQAVQAAYRAGGGQLETVAIDSADSGTPAP